MQNAQSITPQQANALAINAILGTSLVRVQKIYSGSVDPSTNPGPVQIVPRNVGLILGFFVDVTLTLANSAGGVATLTPHGAANALTDITFVDYANYTRHQTKGWHVALLNTARNGRPFGLVQTLASPAIGYGNNWGNVIAAPATIAASATGTVTMRYYIPVAYGRNTLDGAVYANITNAQAQLNLTPNAGAMTAAGDPLNSIYSGSAGTVTNAEITVYQHYRDQLPMASNGAPILPQLSLLNAYMLQTSSLSALVANQDFAAPYTNFRSFLSTFAVFDNGNALNTGSDVNYWALRSANFTDIYKLSANEVALMSRGLIGTDFPAGTYYFDSRNQPIQTNQYGNMQLILNPSNVQAGAYLGLGYEMLGQINLVAQAGSLPAGG